MERHTPALPLLTPEEGECVGERKCGNTTNILISSYIEGHTPALPLLTPEEGECGGGEEVWKYK